MTAKGFCQGNATQENNMSVICDCPFGFEDGEVQSYAATCGRLILKYKFWNECIGTFIFSNFVSLCDYGSLGVIVSQVRLESDSQLLNTVKCRMYEQPPEITPLKQYEFLDVDENTMIAIIAEACSFSAS